MRNLKPNSILITGATGFLGGRAVERIFNDNPKAKVKCLVRDFKKAARIARYPVEMVYGEVTDMDALHKAFVGIDTVIHCAFDPGNGPKDMVARNTTAIENLAAAHMKHPVKSIVHISTISVYGDTDDGDLDESFKSGSPYLYGQAKLAAENKALELYKEKKVPFVVLQPTIIYGPYCAPWTMGPSQQMFKRKLPLVDGGQGFCNAVYVDDVVSAILLATQTTSAVGERFLISGDKPITWKEFYNGFEHALGVEGTMDVDGRTLKTEIHRRGKNPTSNNTSTFGEIVKWTRHPKLWKKIYSLPAIKSSANTINKISPIDIKQAFKKVVVKDQKRLPRSPSLLPNELIIPNEERLKLLQSKTVVRIDKAKKVLKYQPAYSFDQGMQLTGDFLRWFYWLDERTGRHPL